MADEEKEKPLDPKVEFVRKVARETGASEEQVRALVSLLGYDLSSVMREARILKRGQEHRGINFLRRARTFAEALSSAARRVY